MCSNARRHVKRDIKKIWVCIYHRSIRHGYGRIALILVELQLGLKKVKVELHLGSKKYFNKIIMYLKGLDLFYLVTFITI
jgi:hypothetical protein